MDKKYWKYQITNGKTPIILMLIMSALFVGLTLWLYYTNNGAFIFAGLLAAMMLLVLGAVIYRFLFYKVLIGEDGFFYQTGPGNGKYYEYAEIEKAWISTGQEQNGVVNEYCNVTPLYSAMIRFPFFAVDEKAVKYLIKRVEKAADKRITAVTDETREYLIDGKFNAKSKLVITIVLLVMVAILDSIIIKASGLVHLGVPGILLVLGVGLRLLNDYLFFEVQIGASGFYCQTIPFDGQYYEYHEIVDCEEIKRVVRNRAGRGTHRSYYFYFQFTDVSGKTRKFLFEKPVFEHEVNVLQERIKKHGSLQYD